MNSFLTFEYPGIKLTTFDLSTALSPIKEMGRHERAERWSNSVPQYIVESRSHLHYKTPQDFPEGCVPPEKPLE